ncbi:hypothetical protein M885DRAFT_587932 [Pelagophyceae sp. CCMP2097]|nr:hypothetical protein M885DRAFT_587932 [Pelagophyceae sp. CCMP2097]
MWKYTVASSAVTAAVLSYAYTTREQFYPAVVYLVTSKLCVCCLGNQAIVLTLLFGRMAKAVFLGSLREAEVELLYENARYAITETCLALTIFREELTARVFALFSALLFAKVFHWLANSRVEHVERAERVTAVGHARLIALLTWLFALDSLALATCAVLCLRQGPSVLLLFGFEFAILGVVLLASAARYALHGIERRHFDGQWASKGSYVFFVEFAAEALRFVFYVVFFTIVFTYYGVPLHIFRELWVSYASLRRRLSAYRRYRALTANMDTRFETATPEELEARGRVCIICRDAMVDGAANKKLPCGHVFHLPCLRLWLQQQQSCPTCRADIATHGRPAPAAAAQARQDANNDDDDDDDVHDGHAHHHAEQAAADDGAAPPADAAARPAAAGRPQQQANRLVFAVGDSLQQAAAMHAAPMLLGGLPDGAKVWRVVALGGARILTERRRDSPSHRAVARGQHVLTLDERDAAVGDVFLRVGDGWILFDDAVLTPFVDATQPAADGSAPRPAAPPAPPSTPLAARSPSAAAADRRAQAALAASSLAAPAAPAAGSIVVPASALDTMDLIQFQLDAIQQQLRALRQQVAVAPQAAPLSDNPAAPS